MDSDKLLELMAFVEEHSIDIKDVLRELDMDKSSIEEISHHFIDVPGCSENYTLMQFAAKNGKKDFVIRLLDLNINPNIPSGDVKNLRKKSIFSRSNSNGNDTSRGRKENCRSTPLFLAAENGHHAILRIFKYNDPVVVGRQTCINFHDGHCSNKEVTHLHHGSKPEQKVNFRVLNLETKETVLHLVLRQPLIRSKTIDNAEQRKSTHSELHLISKKYNKCVDVLLDMDRFENKPNEEQSYLQQIQAIVNKKDKEGNTPLHYAVLNWSEEVVEMLLVLGANASIRNKFDEIPLSRIRSSTFENFMNKECIKVDGFDQRDDKIEEENSDEEESEKNVTQDYNQSFMMRISRCGKDEDNKMTFRYAFLAPPGVEAFEDTSRLMKSSDYTLGYDLEKQEYGTRDAASKSEYKPEMDLLWEMGRSEEHRGLITHPVIDSYLWMKWKLITKYFHRTLRLHFLFLYCVTWYLLMHFGGYNWNTILISNIANGSEHPIASFCRDLTDELADSNFTGLNDEITQNDGKLSIISRISYFAFWFVFLGQFAMITRDFLSDRFQHSLQEHTVAFWMDLFNILLSVSIIICGKKILWLVITFLLIFYWSTELIEIFTLGSRYFKEVSNYIDQAMIALIVVIIFVPQNYIKNPKIFSVFDENMYDDEKTRCGVKRSIAAIVIVLVWTRFLMAVSKLHLLKSYNLYVVIFFKVLRRYLVIMAWYGTYLIAFGLGFYVMLHNDIKRVVTNQEVEKGNQTFYSFNKTKFDNPFLALMKTSTMFVGEFDFDDLQMRGGDISVSMSYVFLLVFIFLMVIVLMNVLNGLAVSDTGKMLKDCLIESQISIINNIRYFESVYLDLGRIQHIPCLRSDSFFSNFLRKNIVPKKVFLFGSYVTDPEVTFPLSQQSRKQQSRYQTQYGRKESLEGKFIRNIGIDSDIPNAHDNNGACAKLLDWLHGGDENYGTEEFLVKAREIIIHLKTSTIQERKRRKLMKEIGKMKEMNSYADKVKHFENVLQRSFSISSSGNSTNEFLTLLS